VWLSTNIDDHRTVAAPSPTSRTWSRPSRVGTNVVRSSAVLVVGVAGVLLLEGSMALLRSLR
jgi:hypothetical protein